MKRDPVVLIVVAMVVALMLVFGFSMARRSPDNQQDIEAAKARGQVAKDFTLPTTDGKQFHLADMHGKAVLLNFWATWCEPCKIEMPWFIDLQKQYGGQGLQIVGIAMDEDSDPADIASFTKDMGVDYPILVGKLSERETVSSDYGGTPFLPQTFLIGRDGKVVEKILGLKSKSDIEDSIRRSLAPAPTAQAETTNAPAESVNSTGNQNAASKTTSD